MRHAASGILATLVLWGGPVGAAVSAAAAETPIAARLHDFEQAVAGDPENLQVAADYRQLTIAAGQFDRSIDFLEQLAKRKGSGPNVRMSLALAYVDKVP